MPWEISGQVGPHARPGVDGSGWLWEIRRGEGDWPQVGVRRVLVEISGTAGGVDPDLLPSDTAEAIASQGESAVRRAIELDDPPQTIQCGTAGCRPAQSLDD